MRKYLAVVFPQQDCEKGHKIQLRRLPASWSPPIILLAAFLPQLWLTLCPLWGREGGFVFEKRKHLQLCSSLEYSPCITQCKTIQTTKFSSLSLLLCLYVVCLKQVVPALFCRMYHTCLSPTSPIPSLSHALPTKTTKQQLV